LHRSNEKETAEALHSDFVINRFFMELFRTANIHIVKTCQSQFSFDLPSTVIKKSVKKFKESLVKTISS